MPVYEYKCQDCGKISEHRITSQAQVDLVTCNNCGSRNVKRMISVPNITTGRSAASGQTCCGRDERCSDAGRCCGH